MEYSPDELFSMAACLYAALHETTYRRAAIEHREVIQRRWSAVAAAAFTHMDYIKHDRNMAMMDAEMGLG